MFTAICQSYPECKAIWTPLQGIPLRPIHRSLEKSHPCFRRRRVFWPATEFYGRDFLQYILESMKQGPDASNVQILRRQEGTFCGDRRAALNQKYLLG
jgi:hypothetical protein